MTLLFLFSLHAGLYVGKMNGHMTTKSYKKRLTIFHKQWCSAWYAEVEN